MGLKALKLEKSFVSETEVTVVESAVPVLPK